MTEEKDKQIADQKKDIADKEKELADSAEEGTTKQAKLKEELEQLQKQKKKIEEDAREQREDIKRLAQEQLAEVKRKQAEELAEMKRKEADPRGRRVLLRASNHRYLSDRNPGLKLVTQADSWEHWTLHQEADGRVVLEGPHGKKVLENIKKDPGVAMEKSSDSDFQRWTVKHHERGNRYIAFRAQSDWYLGHDGDNVRMKGSNSKDTWWRWSGE